MRERDLTEFYSLLGRLGSPRRLFGATGRDGWPTHGVYFFFEDGELRADGTPRVVRVGTHGLAITSRTRLWQRLAQHRGTLKGGGNHRASIFRRHVGTALIRRDHPPGPLLNAWTGARRLPGMGRRRVRDRTRGQRPHRQDAVPLAGGVHRRRRHQSAWRHRTEQHRATLEPSWSPGPTEPYLARPSRTQRQGPRIGIVEREPRRRRLRSGVPRVVPGAGRRLTHGHCASESTRAALRNALRSATGSWPSNRSSCS